jgi:hypothetical protein
MTGRGPLDPNAISPSGSGGRSARAVAESERVAPKPSPRRTKQQHARKAFVSGFVSGFVAMPWAAILPYLIPVVTFIVVSWLWEPLTGEVSQRPFFEATATVFPVLLLTLAVQARFFARQAPTAIGQSDRPQPKHVALVLRWSVRLYAFQCLVVLAFGELASLRALARSDGPSMEQTAVAWAALLAAFVALAITALAPAAPVGTSRDH